MRLSDDELKNCAGTAEALSVSLAAITHLQKLRAAVVSGGRRGLDTTRLLHTASGMGFDMPRELLVEMLDRSISKKVLQLMGQGVNLIGDANVSKGKRPTTMVFQVSDPKTSVEDARKQVPIRLDAKAMPAQKSASATPKKQKTRRTGGARVTAI